MVVVDDPWDFAQILEAVSSSSVPRFAR